LAKFAATLKAGTPVIVEGKIKPETYTADGADIMLDGKFAGSTPSTFQMKSGDHSVRVELSGFVPWEKSLTITAGGQITLNANLQRKSSDAPQ
jgi:hypothetical protein